MNDVPVLVSACLAGEACRYDGTAKPHPEIVRLVREGSAVAVCPEMLGGLPAPREPAEISGARVVTAAGNDVTAEFLRGARKCLAIARERGCTRAVLKARSPSCGCGTVYDGTFSRRLIAGDGVFAALLKANGVDVSSEEDL